MLTFDGEPGFPDGEPGVPSGSQEYPSTSSQSHYRINEIWGGAHSGHTLFHFPCTCAQHELEPDSNKGPLCPTFDGEPAFPDGEPGVPTFPPGSQEYPLSRRGARSTHFRRGASVPDGEPGVPSGSQEYPSISQVHPLIHRLRLCTGSRSGSVSGSYDYPFLSPHAVDGATVSNIDDIATQDEFRNYFKTYGPMIFSVLKNDKKTLNQRGHGGAAANLAKDMGWASVIQATNADRAEKIMGSMK